MKPGYIFPFKHENRIAMIRQNRKTVSNDNGSTFPLNQASWVHVLAMFTRRSARDTNTSFV